MSAKAPRWLVVTVFAAVGALLLVRALQGGGPLYYFLSAVFFGMAFAALQAMRQPPGG